MARIFSPSGETEFFQITEIQQAFERELLTGEKIEIIPGMREVSILREAPVRAELGTLYEQFRDRVLNPTDPFQPPVPFFSCPTWIGYPDGQFESGNASGVSASPNPPELHVTLNQTYPGIAQWVSQSAFTVGNPVFGGFSFLKIPWSITFSPQPQNLANFSGGYGPTGYYGPTVNFPGAFTAQIGVAWWNPTGPNSIQNMQLGIQYNNLNNLQPTDPTTAGGYASPIFSCTNIPANNSATPIPIATISADYNRVQYSCLPTLQNFTFTNLYP